MDNQKFWNERYLSLPSLGSGPGSRAYAAWLKRRLIGDLVTRHGIRSILDIGCGDLCWLEPEPFAGVAYTGVDIADVIVAANRAHYPQFEFLLHDIRRAPLPATADLVVCFDVLIHQIERVDFDAALRNVLDTIGGTGLISYMTPDGASPPPLPETPAGILADEQQLQTFLREATFPRAQMVFHGELDGHVHTLLPHAHVAPVAAYPMQTIYQLTK